MAPSIRPPRVMIDVVKKYMLIMSFVLNTVKITPEIVYPKALPYLVRKNGNVLISRAPKSL